MSLNANKVHALGLFGFTVMEKSDGSFDICGIHNKRGYSFKIVKDTENRSGRSYMYKIVPPSYSFNGINSHFTYQQDEYRLFRNKTLITKIVIALQKTEVWELLSNQDFFKINTANKKAIDIKKISDFYKFLISTK